MPAYLLIDAECGEVTAVTAISPILAARAVDLSFGETDHWYYSCRPASGAKPSVGFEVFEATPGLAAMTADRARAELRAVALVDKLAAHMPGAEVIAPARAKRSFARAVRTACAAAAVMAVMIGAAWLSDTKAGAAAKPPTEVFSSRMDTPYLKAGGRIRVTDEIRRNRLCPVSIEITFVRAIDSMTIARRRLPAGSLAITRRPVKRTFTSKLPPGIEPGDYLYRRVAFSECDGKTYPAVIADSLPFTVTR